MINKVRTEGNVRARPRRGVRKVRTPQGRVPGNARAPRGDGKCNRKHTAFRLFPGHVPGEAEG